MHGGSMPMPYARWGYKAMPMMRVCIRNERQPAVHEVMQQLHTSDPKVAVDWIIADWLTKREQVAGTAPPQPATAAVTLDIAEW